ncbi:helix-turn-helix transcriptional regulator [Ochrobactrum pecoris]|nr:helix-turn-helix transcriptional regulator [Brucella pecoris]
MVGQEVQDGLFATGYDVRFLDDIVLEETVEPSLLCAVPLSGQVSPMEVEGFGKLTFESSSPILLCFGQPGHCRTFCRSGQHSAVGGFTIRQSFLDRVAEAGNDRAIQNLRRLFEKDFSAIRFPASTELRIAAAKTLDLQYSGTLARLHLESCALAFVTEVARLINEIGCRAEGVSSRHYDQVVRARDLLDENIARPPTIEALTKMLGVNATTLRSNFLKIYGTTIFGHVRNRRLEVAQFLLRTHDLNISEVAYRVGFTNAGAFSSAYRKHYGYSPRQETTSKP